MATLEKSEIVELARKTREIDDSPSVPLEPYYLRSFEKHAAKFPNDLNFIIELADPSKPSVGGNGYGVTTCLEDYCWIDVRLGSEPAEKDGGRSRGFGSLWEYEVHCETPAHVKGRNERCSKSKTYVPTDGGNVPAAAAPAAAVAGPSRLPAPAANARATSSQTAPRTAPAAATPRAAPAAASSSGMRPSALHETTKHNIPKSSPLSSRESKPYFGGSQSSAPKKSVLSMLDGLDDDEVSVVRPEDIPLEFRKVTNKDTPYTLEDEDDAPSSSSAGPSRSQTSSAAAVNPGRTGPVIPKTEIKQAAAASVIPWTAQDLPRLQADLARLKQDRDQYIRQAYGILLGSPRPTAEVNAYAQKMAGLLYGQDVSSYPVLPYSISISLPSFVAIDNTARAKHDNFCNASRTLTAQTDAARTAGVLAPVGSNASFGTVIQAQAQAGPSNYGDAVAAAIAAAAAAPRELPNPLGLEGDELEDYHATVYGERNAPTNLQDFFQDAVKDFSDDQDIGKALATLGLTDMNQRFADMTCSLMPHQILGVAFMLLKERDKRYRGGLLCDAMGLGKTVQTIATIAGNLSEDGRCKTTLIVAPLAVINQWRQEIESKTADGLLSVYIYHGTGKTKTSKELKHADVVLTTYGTLVSDFAEPKVKKKKVRRPEDGSGDDDDTRAPVTRKKGPLFRMKWYRVVLDEAHFIRNKATQASRAVWDLEAVYRWSLTGTLINNTLDDVFPHLRFLGISPQSDYAEFSKHITKRVKAAPRLAARRTQVWAILKTCMMRRHKESMLNGQRLLNLPPKETIEVELDFSPEERAIYDGVEKKMKIKFGKFLKQGTLLKHMSCVLAMIMRLRQLTCHPWLLRRNPGDPSHPDDFEVSEEDLNASMNIPVVNAGADFIRAVDLMGEEWVADVSARLKTRHDDAANAPAEAEDAAKWNECGICLDVFDGETITQCKHSYCQICISEIFNTAPGDGGDLTDEESARGARKCPLCRGIIEKNKVFAAVAFFDAEKEDEEEGAAGSSSAPGSDRKGKRKMIENGDGDSDFEDTAGGSKRLSKGKGKATAADEDEEEEPMDEIRAVLPSTKMKVLAELLDEYLAEDGIKVIVFSEFVSYLTLVERYLDSKDIPNRMYTGQMRNSDRMEVIKEFTGPIKNERSPRVMLISRKAGGAGLNLTAASKVISLDLAWNAAAENQAVDRAHRIGQTRPVDVRRLIIKDTIEQRILALQEKKSALADGAMGEGAGGRLGRLTVQDLMKLFDYNAADDD